MGVHNLLLLLIVVLLVGIAIMIALSIFDAQSTAENKDGITSGLVRVAADAYSFKTRPAILGGGSGAYDESSGANTPYRIPANMSSDYHGTYSVTAAQPHSCILEGISSKNSSWHAICVVDDGGNASIKYFGW
ncbi:MAG TPA: hypothetical protein VMH23_14015 [Bacteroidota bacterium]|nr:hypothetical protein [Bacteroidota bacterium]